MAMNDLLAMIYVSDVQLAARFGVHRATVWRWTKVDPSFPKPVVLSPGCTRWKMSEIESWEQRRAETSK